MAEKRGNDAPGPGENDDGDAALPKDRQASQSAPDGELVEREALNETAPEDVGVENLGRIGDRAALEHAARKSLHDLAEERVAELAREEIKKWHTSRKLKLKDPTTWGASIYSVAAALIFLVFLILAEFMSDEEEIIRDFVHNRLGTEERIHASIAEMMTGETGNAMSNLVFRRVERSPILAFHGQAVLGAIENVRIVNPYCKELLEQERRIVTRITPTVASEWDNLDPAEEVEPLKKVTICESDVAVFPLNSLDVPFFGRFYKSKNGPADTVQIMLDVGRFDRITKEEVPETDETNLSGMGLCILYNSDRQRRMKDSGVFAREFNITDLFVEDGRGHWVADLGAYLQENFGGRRPPASGSREHLHSISILFKAVGEEPLPRDETVSDDANQTASDPGISEEENAKPACPGVTPQKDKIVNVNVIVLTNKRFDDRP